VYRYSVVSALCVNVCVCCVCVLCVWVSVLACYDMGDLPYNLLLVLLL